MPRSSVARADSLTPAPRDTKLSPHFTLAEFLKSETANARNIENTVANDEHMANLYTTASIMELVRAKLGNKPILVTSGYRCPELNAAVGGVPDSQHALGQACDFVCPQYGTPLEIAAAISQSTVPFDQLIYEKQGDSRWVHISQRPNPRRQVLTLHKGQYVPGIVA
jgi:hypothetical protein